MMRPVLFLANDHAVKIVLDKTIGSDDFDITYRLASVNVRDFLFQFGIDAEELKPISDTKPIIPVFPASMNTEKERLGIPGLTFTGSTIKGVLAPGKGFELTVKGSVAAPELLSDAKNLFIVIQDFKKPDADVAESEETYDTPAAALFASYEGDRVDQIIYTLTGHTVPALDVFKGEPGICITAATRSISFVNTEELRLLLEKFTPAKGFNVIEQGLKVMHYAANADKDIKDDQNKVSNNNNNTLLNVISLFYLL